MTMLPTRGQYALPGNKTPKQLAAQTKRQMAQIRANIEKLSEPWADVDNSVDGAKDQLMAAFEDFERHINGAVQYLLECAE